VVKKKNCMSHSAGKLFHKYKAAAEKDFITERDKHFPSRRV